MTFVSLAFVKMNDLLTLKKKNPFSSFFALFSCRRGKLCSFLLLTLKSWGEILIKSGETFLLT